MPPLASYSFPRGRRLRWCSPLPLQFAAGELPLRMSDGSETRVPPRQFVREHLADQSHNQPLAPYRLSLSNVLPAYSDVLILNVISDTCQAEIKE
jgi:hypothetical protein